MNYCRVGNKKDRLNVTGGTRKLIIYFKGTRDTCVD